MEDYLDELNPYTGELSEEENEDDFLAVSLDELNATPEILEDDANLENFMSNDKSVLISTEALADDLEIGGDVGSLPL